MVVSRPPKKRKKRRSNFRFLLVVTATTAMVATGGFGALPENPLTQTFQEVIGENITEELLESFNSLMESIAAPTIQPRTDSALNNNPPPDPLGFLLGLFNGDSSPSNNLLPEEMNVVETAVAFIDGTQTQLALTLSTSTPTETLTATATQTPTATITLLPSLTVTPSPVWIAQPVIISSDTPRPTSTASPTATVPLTTTVTWSVGEFTVSNLDLGEGIGVLFDVDLGLGEQFNIKYDYTVSNNLCPGCTVTLVTGLGSSGTGVCTYSGVPGSSPGSSGSESSDLRAPAYPGAYNVSIEYFQSMDCASALSEYGTGAADMYWTVYDFNVIVSPAVIMYLIPGYNGNLGGRAGADAICFTYGPTGYTNYRALIGLSGSDSISDMPANYGVPTAYSIITDGGNRFAHSWDDLMNTNVFYALDMVFTNADAYWWSGAIDDAGSGAPVTETCNDWTDNSSAASGWVGDTNPSIIDINWMSTGTQTCDQIASLVCIAYP